MALPDYRMHIRALTLREMVNSVREGDIDLNPPYQRSDVWTTTQRVNLIKSFLLGVPVAAVILNRRGSNNEWAEVEGKSEAAYYAVIDGKQRITTGMLWFRNELPVPTVWFREEWVPEGYDSSWITHDSLTKPAHRFMGLNFTVPVAEAQLPSLVAEAEVYGLINAAGTAQTEEDLARAREIAGR